jgi:hypothetical protein
VQREEAVSYVNPVQIYTNHSRGEAKYGNDSMYRWYRQASSACRSPSDRPPSATVPTFHDSIDVN